MKFLTITMAAGWFMLQAASAQAIELVIGEERVKPGIVYIFEGAIKDHIMLHHNHLAKHNTIYILIIMPAYF